MYSIGDQYDVAVHFDDEEIVYAATHLIELLIFERADMAVPSLRLALQDTPYLRETLRVHDACKITVEVQPRAIAYGTGYEHMVFRLLSVSTAQTPQGDTLVLHAIYDAPRYVTHIDYAAYEGTSADVARKIAADSGLREFIDASNDAQIWLRSGVSGYRCLLDILPHAWGGEGSFYGLAVTRSGYLKYVDLGKRRKDEPYWGFVDHQLLADRALEDNETVFVDLKAKLNSGFFNHFQGYGVLRQEFDLLEGSYHPYQEFALGELEKTTDYLEIRKDMVEMPVRFEPGFVDVGNTHPNYLRAYAQNLRYWSTYSYRIQIVVSLPMHAYHVLDWVRVESANHIVKGLREVYSGNYFITAIQSRMSEVAFIQVLELAREGSNTVPESDPPLL